MKKAFLPAVAMFFFFASSLAALPYLGLPYDPLQITASLNSYGDKPNLLAIYVLAFDNPSLSPANLTAQLPETLPSIIEATVNEPYKRAVVLIDAHDQNDTHIRVIENGETTLIGGLPDSSGSLDPGLYEYDTADGATLGGFLKWTLDTYANESTKTIFSYVAHGAALVPESDNLPGATTSLRQATTTPGLPLPVVWRVHPAFSDYNAPIGTDTYTQTLLSPYDLASALEVATNNGQHPIAVLDLVHCFAASIEEFYELSNPDGSPYAATMAGSPNYAYLNPTMLGAALEAVDPSLTDEELAATLIKTYDDSIAEGDSNPSQNPGILVAVNSDKMAPIKEAWDQTSFYLLQQFDANFNNTKNGITAAYGDSAKYDTSFCEADWALDTPDALVDMADFANQLSGEFGSLSQVGSSALTTKLRVEEALIDNPITDNPLFANGSPWFGDGDQWTFDGNSGIALYADFEGMTIQGEKHLSWQAHWYTDTITLDNPQPYAFLEDDPVVGVSWADAFNRFWDGQTVKTAACVPPLPPAVQPGEVSVEQIIFPFTGSVSQGTPVSLSAVIKAEEIAVNPAVEFAVTQNNTIVFSDTVGAGYLVTGTYQIDASQTWVPDTTGSFMLSVTVDADNRISETNENNNTDTLTDIVWPPSDRRPIITATVTNDLQWMPNNVVDLDIVQASETNPPSVGVLTIQLYEYQPGDNPNIQVPVNTHTETISNVPLPWSSDPFTLPAGLNPGPIVLHVWAHSAGGWSPMPDVVKFNYNPPNTTLAEGEEQYFRFHALRNDTLQMDLNLSSGDDANLFVWDPYNYGSPTWLRTNIGDDDLDESMPANGEYVVTVYGETTSTYTLDVTRNAIPGGRMSEQRFDDDNPDAYVPARPLFLEPIPKLPNRGDCNDDGAVKAADIPALINEIFDGDGNSSIDVPGGTYPGDPIGCDANANQLITAADITCTIKIIFNGPDACGSRSPLTLLRGTPSRSSLPEQPMLAPDSMEVPITLATNAHGVSSLIASIDYDEELLSFDPTDKDGDGIPDAMAINVPASFQLSVEFNPTDSDGEIDLFIGDLSLPLDELPDGTLASITFGVEAETTDLDGAVSYSTDPAPSLGNHSGEEISLDTTPGSLDLVARQADPPNPADHYLYLPIIVR
ncbi:MAG: CARDB domain-containing protein [Ardenticatenaceae bacterium]